MMKKLLCLLLCLFAAAAFCPRLIPGALADLPEPLEYEAYNPKTGLFETRICENYTSYKEDTTVLKDGVWYVIDDRFVQIGRVTVDGNVNLILKNNRWLNLGGSFILPKGTSLTIYAQPVREPLYERQGSLDISTPWNYGTAGIGGETDTGSLTIHGGRVSVYGANDCAAIGGGKNGNGGTVTLYGGTLHAGANRGGPRAIGAGKGGTSHGTFNVRPGYTLYDIEKKQVISKATGASWIETLCGDSVFVSLVEEEAPAQTAVPYQYVNGNGRLTNAKATKYFDLDKTTGVLANNWYVLKEDLTVTDLPVNGDAHLILTDGSTLTVRDRFLINEGSKLTIYTQSTGSKAGALNANTGVALESGTELTIHGGKLTARGSSVDPGIGPSGTLTVKGGTISAFGGGKNSGIRCDTVNFQGGYTTALAGAQTLPAVSAGKMTFGKNCRVFINDQETPLSDPAAFERACAKNPKARVVFGNYPVTVTSDGHGTVSASPKSGCPGTRVKLTVKPAKGYEFDKWQVLSGDVTITENQFLLGNGEAKIKAIFRKTSSSPDTGDHSHPALLAALAAVSAGVVMLSGGKRKKKK